MNDALAGRTWKSYSSAIKQYREYMAWNRLDEEKPTEEAICKWIAFLSLFIEPISICRYLSAVRYFLDENGKNEEIHSNKVSRMVRGVCRRHGLPDIDDREIITINLLLKIMKIIDLQKHDDRCCMAACIIAFLNCLRCGEFTVSSKTADFDQRGLETTRGQGPDFPKEM
jgi:site-specific recombinase XerD